MSLGTRLTLKTAVLVLAVVVVAGASLWGLAGLNRDLDAALIEYDRLQAAYILSREIDQARSIAKLRPNDASAAAAPLQRALVRLNDPDNGFSQGNREAADRLRVTLSKASDELAVVLPGDAIDPVTEGRLNDALNQVAAVIDDASMRIAAIENDANAHRQAVVLWVSGTALVAALLAIAVGIWQYAAVMRPLNALQRGVQRLASGDFDDRLLGRGDREFAALASDFNRMAEELATLYQQLDQKVRIRSAQLAQSERLASVGFLAAGVAHEINNPLAIIAGEAELALAQLERNDANTHQADQAAAIIDVLTTTRDEAFRCKAITEKLLSLAKPGRSARERVDARAVAADVASLVRALPQHSERELNVAPGQQAIAHTDPAQLKQVLLNLVINALEAVQPGEGRVELVIHRDPDTVRIEVRDNGQGLDADALDRVFQPFYTAKKSPTTPGLGLGLSISHAITQDLGGRLLAESPGPGKGSVFTIELPAAGSAETENKLAEPLVNEPAIRPPGNTN